MKFPLALLALCTGLLLSAGADEIRRVTLDGTPNAPAPEQEDGKDGIARIHKVEEASLELFATGQKPARGTVLISPGGGYSILAVTHEGRAVAAMLNAAGWDAAVLLYHVNAGAQTRELAIADAKKALALLQTKGAALGLSTRMIGAMGFSAGGHLTARLGHETADTHPPDFLVLMYPAYLEKDGKVLDEVAPAHAPAFVYVAGDDKFAPSGATYAGACREQKVLCEFYQPEHGGHGFGLKTPLPAGVQDWPDKLRAFLTVLPGKAESK